MNMGKVLESLKKYFEETPKEQLDKDFKEINNKWGHIGPTVEEWLESNFKKQFCGMDCQLQNIYCSFSVDGIFFR